MPDVRAVEAALADLRTAYQADGYELVVDAVTGGTAKMRVTAGPGACAECLVPNEIAVSTIIATLGALTGITHVELAYPAEAASGGHE
jgi:hypothetical protein